MGRVGVRLNSLLLREVPALRLRLGRDDRAFNLPCLSPRALTRGPKRQPKNSTARAVINYLHHF